MAPEILIPVIAAAVAAFLAAFGSFVVSDRLSKSQAERAALELAALARKTALELETSAKKSDLEIIKNSYTAQQAGYISLQATYAAENARLNMEVSALRSDNVKLVEGLANNKAECLVQIAQLRQQVILLTAKLPNPGDVVPVKLVDSDIKLPVQVDNPLPLPVDVVRPISLSLATAQARAAASEAAAEE